MKFPCKQICPGCEKITLVKQVNKLTTIMVKGKPIEVEDSFLECQECKLEFEDPRNPYDVLKDISLRNHIAPECLSKINIPMIVALLEPQGFSSEASYIDIFH